MDENRRPQRLYLAKGDNEDSNIYVDTICLPNHQYDGIRFLYRQFKKGKAGTILNDPPGYGKRVQTVLFLNAMCPVATLPTLILCNEGIEEVWTQQFRQWTDMGSDVFVQKGNEYTKSMCVIGAISQINVLCRREWGFLVVDDNNVSREALRSGINAKYRIWLTSLDMKKNLQTFSLIYKWLYPRDKFILEDFQMDKKPTTLLSNSARLDAFMEDIVLRRRDGAVPLGKPCHTTDRQQVTKKNKDATGRKIKRSKPLPDDDHNTSAESQETGSEHNISVELANYEKVNDKKESSDDFVVNITENKMRDVTSKEVSEYFAMKTVDNDEKREKTDALDTGFNPGDNEVPKIDSNPKSYTRDDSFTLLNRDIDIDSQNIIKTYDSETQDNQIENFIPAKKTKITNEINVSEDLFSTDIVKSDTKSEKVNNHDTNAEISLKISENLFSTDLPTNEISDEIKTGVNCKDNELANKSNVSENNKTEILN